MTEPAPALSIIFGTYNRFKLLKQCVEACRKSVGDRSYEFVICDGGSHDGSREWLVAQEDVTLIAKRELHGAVDAFNECWLRARGDYVVNLNDDAAPLGKALDRAATILDERADVGQVAMGVMRAGRPGPEVFRIQGPYYYANFGVTRSRLVEDIAAVCGGFWAPCYRTYGADTELSCWVYRFGSLVYPLAKATILDHLCDDNLRVENHRDKRARKDSALFWKRWSNVPEQLKPGGQLPNISELERHVLEALESGVLV